MWMRIVSRIILAIKNNDSIHVINYYDHKLQQMPQMRIFNYSLNGVTKLACFMKWL